MAWADYTNAVPAELGGDAGVRFNAATGRNYLPVNEFNAEGQPTVTGYISFEPHANRSNEGAYVRHDLNGNVTGYGNFDPRNKSFRNFLLAAGAMAGGAALLGAGGVTGGVTGAASSGAASVGGSGAFLGEGVLSGVASWDAAYAAAAAGATSTAATVGSTLKSALSAAQTYLKPALSLASAFTGGATGTPTPEYVPFDQPATASGVHPLVWAGLAIGVLYLLLEK